MHKITKAKFPRLLNHMSTPPKHLYIEGSLPRADAKILTIVGTRRPTPYGKAVCQELIKGLSGQDICIVSGLAIGIDGIAHEAALEAGLQTVAFPGSGLHPDVLYPFRHAELARKIVASGGGLISEFEPDFHAIDWSFPQRNRLMAGIADAVLIIESTIKSGTLITAKYASDFNRDLLVVPGPITSKYSDGPNMYIRKGAIPITSSDDILEALGLPRSDEEKVQQELLFSQQELVKLSSNERRALDLAKSCSSRDELIEELNLPARETNIILSSLEIRGLIKF